MMSTNKFLSNLTMNYRVRIRAMFDLQRTIPVPLTCAMASPILKRRSTSRRAVFQALREGRTKYGTEPGLPAMRQAVANKYTKQFGRPYDMDNVMVTIGGVEGIFMALMTILNPGDEVIIPDPAYTCYVGQTLTLGGVPVRVPLYEEHGFRLQAEDLEKAITPKTKAIVITYPSNPLGAVLDRADGEALAKVIEKHNIMVISDEVYEKIIFDGREHFSLAQIESIKDKVLVVNSLSKTYAMTGWRLGYVVGWDKDLMKHMFKMQQAVASCLPIFTMQAGADAINGPQDCVEDMRRQYERRRDLLYNGLKEIPGMKPFRTEGSFCTFINIKDFGVSSWEFSKELLVNAGVMTIAGTAFGEMGEGYLRICFANSDENILEGVKRIKEYVERRGH